MSNVSTEHSICLPKLARWEVDYSVRTPAPIMEDKMLLLISNDVN